MRTIEPSPVVISTLSILFAAAASAACGPLPTGTGTGGTGGAGPSCPTNSGYEGDDVCIPPPAPGEGIQLHVGPRTYDAAAVAPFLLAPNTENVSCYFSKTSNTAQMYYFREQIRMRPHTHHLIMTIISQDHPDGWGPCIDIFGGGATGSIMGSQTPIRDIPDTPQTAPENVGLARVLPPHAQVQYQLHYYNFTPSPILREVWVNLYSMDPSEATQPITSAGMIGGLDLAVPPNSQQVARYGCSTNATGRIYDIFGHYHAHTERFTMWRVRGTERLNVYESFDWVHPANFTYDSVNQNPVADRVNKIAGAYSGDLDVLPGDRFEWECAINNTSSQTLRFANEVNTGEMCIAFGSFVPEGSSSGLGCLGSRTASN